MIAKVSGAQVTNENRKQLLKVWVIILLTWMFMTSIPFFFTGQTERWIVDYSDLSAYFERGKWLTENRPPVSEYPQIPTMLFGFNHLIAMQFDESLQFHIYIATFSLGMMLALFWVVKTLLDLLPPSQGNYAWLALLPPTLYFTYNRFDILPACLCLSAYYLATKKQWLAISIVLAIATFTKWYPVLLFPGFFMYATTQEGKFQWKMILFFIITSSTILLFSYLQGGIETIMAPYQFHMNRNMEYVALPVLVNNLLDNLLETRAILPYYFLFFFVMQISAPLLVFFTKINSLDALTRYCIVTIGVFVLFSRIWSPQWFLWLIPFLIISIRNTKDVELIIVYNLVSYLCFPILFDASRPLLQISVPVLYVILLTVIIRSFKGLQFANGLIKLF